VGERSEDPIKTESVRGRAVKKSEFLPQLSRLTSLFGAASGDQRTKVDTRGLPK